MSVPTPVPLDLAAIRARHTTLLLQLLWERDRARVDIARDLGMSRSAISSIVSELIGVGLVQEGNTRGVGAPVAGRRCCHSMHGPRLCWPLTSVPVTCAWI
ncbi:winged helix-turn-helix domain-containing protein [Deinococcus malanensis]|uniref:winged helix-turn-helix domain-containing protein n=1 Tax=Deinococcus malanensis TaxID=1706855 RepID=UPI00363EAF7D